MKTKYEDDKVCKLHLHSKVWSDLESFTDRVKLLAVLTEL